VAARAASWTFYGAFDVAEGANREETESRNRINEVFAEPLPDSAEVVTELMERVIFISRKEEISDECEACRGELNRRMFRRGRCLPLTG